VPIIAVAVKKVGFSKPPTDSPKSASSSQKPGMMPIRVSGIEIMRMRGIA
jgi:hypothetical protein